jgi:N-acetylmuramoyl-L-alanine amidase
MRFTSSVLIILILSTVFLGNAAGLAFAQPTRPVVVLHPGHGLGTGTGIIDPGEVSGDLVEKEITQDVARQTRDLLERCDVDVYLTHERDDHDNTIEDIAGIVNDFNPTLAVSIHTNTGGVSDSGAEGWYTVGGHNDASSQALAVMLADGISAEFSIPNQGSFPETQSQYAILPIHDWNAPSAQINLGYLQGDGDYLRHERRDFARSIARTLLSYLNLPLECANHATVQGIALAVYFPEEQRTNSVTLLNDGLLPWEPTSFDLRITSDPFGAPASVPLGEVVLAGEMVTWDSLPATAPGNAGIHRQKWQLHLGDDPIGDEATVFLIVVPQEAAELREDVERRIDEIIAEGQQRLEEELEQLAQEILESARQRITDWASNRINEICGSGSAAIGMVAFAFVWGRRKKSASKD